MWNPWRESAFLRRDAWLAAILASVALHGGIFLWIWATRSPVRPHPPRPIDVVLLERAPGAAAAVPPAPSPKATVVAVPHPVPHALVQATGSAAAIWQCIVAHESGGNWSNKSNPNYRGGLQFSFATKLAHMVDPRLPVYDSLVAAFYFHVPRSGASQLETRLRDLLSFYKFLRVEYARVLGDGLLADAIQRFRARFPDNNEICDERVVDWLLWAWVSLIHRGAQQRGEFLYD